MAGIVTWLLPLTFPWVTSSTFSRTVNSAVLVSTAHNDLHSTFADKLNLRNVTRRYLRLSQDALISTSHAAVKKAKDSNGSGFRLAQPMPTRCNSPLAAMMRMLKKCTCLFPFVPCSWTIIRPKYVDGSQEPVSLQSSGWPRPTERLLSSHAAAVVKRRRCQSAKSRARLVEGHGNIPSCRADWRLPNRGAGGREHGGHGLVLFASL